VTNVSSQNSQSAHVVTRVEIIDAVGTVFGRSGATKQEIIAAASQKEGRDDLLAALQRLPERSFSHVRDLWDHLPDIPIGD
jgi:hypothetical protein